MIVLFVASLGVASLVLVWVYVREVSTNIDMVLDDNFVSCIQEDFTNDAALSFDVV